MNYTAQLLMFLVVVALGVATIVVGLYLRTLMRDDESLPMQRESAANAFIICVLGFLASIALVFTLGGPAP